MSNSSPADANQPWDLQLARGMYNIHRWGAKYFDINDAGRVVATPLQEAGVAVDISDVIEEAKGRGLKFPLLIRFQDILRHRVESINLAFRNSIAEFNYQGTYRGVFPIKVNQLREVVEEILDAGKPYQFGLEVGSKPELFAGLCAAEPAGVADHLQRIQGRGLHQDGDPGAEAGQEGHSRGGEAGGIAADHQPVQTTGRGADHRHPGAAAEQGRGQVGRQRGGEREVRPEHRRAAGGDGNLERGEPGHCFKLLHFHIGSQVPDILTVKKAVQEAARFYAKLFKMGFAIEYLDVGGGLGVDYDGSRSAFDSSTNYTLQEYTNDIVYYVGDVCNAEKVPHPQLISESGRAIVAHHSMLVVEVFGAIEKIRSR